MKSVVKKKRKQKTAFSLVEMLVVIVIIAALVGLAVPAINAMQKSFNSTGAEGMISAALSTARTLAISNQQYAGVRFQKAYSPRGSLETDQYMIFVIYQPPNSDIGLTMMFKAIEGYKPIKLPENVSIIDMMIRTNIDDSKGACENTSDDNLKRDDLDDSILDRTITDTSAFSIVFSPAGKLVVHDVRTRNKEGSWRPSTESGSGYDDVFNSIDNIKNNNTGQFVQDDYAQFGLGGEKSRREFKLYDCEKFKNLTNKTQRWDYLSELKSIYVNAYTGEIIKN